ncbi:LCP family protein [Vescimonas sp.]|uniref:LCP family protein n=1 Tax=Vescimonas sp. TaxID=2892404 RepID=UPI00307B9A59
MDKQRESFRARRIRRTKLDWFGIIMMFVLLVCSLAIFARLMATKMLTTTNMVLIMVALLVVNGLHIFVQLPLRRNKLGKLICGVLAVVLSVVMIYGTVAAGAVQSALNKISGIMVEKQVTAVIVMKEDDATELGDTRGYKFGILANRDQENTQKLLSAMQESMGQIDTREYETPADMADALYDDEIQAMILNEGYISLLTEQEDYSDFSSHTKIIYEYVTEHEITSIKPSGSITKQPFVIYCSGSDERDSDINAKSRSDVNILAVVNPKTRQILLINTPRDYYLPLAFNGELDKLTHAGMYGVQESMAVLDNLYGTKTSYYGRINFWGLIDIVDALGGIDVYSDYAFDAAAGDVEGYGYRSFSFSEGWNHLEGQEALAFSRERYSFSDGDNQRGKNQMKVIQAIIEKATSPSVLAKYQDLLKAVSDNFITNISYDQISSLVQMMQKDGASWNIQTMSATQGSGDTMQPCYSSYGELLYVMPPDYDSVNRIREVIDQVMNGEEIVLPAE